MTGDEELESMARTLVASGDYKVLRRLHVRDPIVPPAGAQVRVGVVVDVETTGLDPLRDEIIELAMMPFTYGLDGTVYAVGESFQKLRDPGRPIPPQITAITGIDDAMVEGRSIDPAEVVAFVASADVVIAHNAAFDRRFVERFCAAFVVKPWACSMTQIDWAAEGFEGSKLAYLIQSIGLFYERHRAEHDCLATVELLATELPKSGGSALARLLEAARRPSWRIWADNSPFDLKDALKARGYRWNGQGAPPRAWYIDVRDEDREAELRFLTTEIYRSEYDPLVRRIDAYDRFSDRC
ncbi:3'-5' exonuclease [Methylosinus sp. H3A]|uniref:3'-5' exonuclease n=1 Tax=Hyphomicrobiales TaxID=356 RepID=UPI0018C245AB|nr:3'-5' exonuclease [Methylosinus sp. H3A]MBG0808153.1 3'-5' exonuclease [Methylosinus sp. H3A]